MAANNAATPFENAPLITELRRVQDALRESERELRKAHDELESKVAARTSELRRSEQELRDVIDTIPAIVLGGLPDGSKFYVNSRFVEYAGMSREQIAGFGWRAAFHPDDLPQHLDKWHTALKASAIFENELRLRRADGQYRCHLFRGLPLRDESGNIVRWYGVLTDIEDRKRAEQALQTSQAYLMDAQKLSHTGSWAFNPAGFDYWSSELFRIHGLDPAGKPPTTEEYVALVHPEDRAFVVQQIQKVLKDHCGFDFTKRIVRPDGKVRHVRCVGIPVLDNGVLKGFLGTAMDVTEQEQLTEELQRREADLAEAQRLSQTGSWAWSPDQDIRYWSEECYRVLSFDPQDGLPRFEEFFERIHPDDQPGFRELIQTAIREKSEWEADYRIVHLDGRVRDIHVVGHPVLSTSGQLVEFVGTVIDVTERRRAEQERSRLRQLEADLAHINRLSMMGEMAASLAHEVKQPIASSRNNARAALNFLNRSPPDLGEVREAVGCIVGDADRAANIIDRIRDHIQKTPPRKDQFDLNTAIKEVIELARSAITQYGVSVETRLMESLVPVQGDRVQLQQVVLNLVLNSVEAMRSGESGARKLSISTEQDHAGVLVAVRDSGPGIDPTHLERIFEAFYTTKSGGVGMGLSICRSIIDAHGGRLWAEANEPQGAIFRFTLPRAEKELTNSPQPSHQAGEPREELRYVGASHQPAAKDAPGSNASAV